MISKKDIDLKFEGISHKWVTVNFEEESFPLIKNEIIIAKKSASNKVETDEFLHLAKCFKFQGFGFIKFLKNVGSKNNFRCECNLVTEKNFKHTFRISPSILYQLPLLTGTPKSNKLYKLEKGKRSNNWKKPNDGFSDDIDVPLDYEFTEDGYYLYKGYYEEQQANPIKKERNWQKVPPKFISMLSW